MKKDGFTLLELMIVVLIVAVIGVAATISFSTIDSDTSQLELKNKYFDFIIES